MESNRIDNGDGLAAFFEGYEKSRSHTYGYSEFIIAIASADGLKKPSENEINTQNSLDTPDDEE